jgi:peptidoglycan/xylan/chitin deacetylase (PgdA/CDA1 family)
VRFLQFIAATCLMLVCAVATGHAEKRVALVIGNGAYRYADKLANPVNDAQGMRDALKKLGFDVIYGADLDQKALRRTIGQFADRVADADVAMVYFAGHGATFGDTPYVVPVDAEFSSLGQVAYELVPVETLIGELRQAKGVRIAILDACRDNAAEQALKRQASRGAAVIRGLAPMRNPGGLIIAYATQYLSTAADDAGGAGPGGGLFSWGNSSTRHSPFTAALLNNIATPGLDVKDMFYKVGRDVIAATGGKQRPEISISLYDQYALAPSAGPPTVQETRPPQFSPALGAPANPPAPPKPTYAHTCANPNAMGVSRIVEIDTAGGPGFGSQHFKTFDFLRDHEVVLTFDDGPWPNNTQAVLKALADQCLRATFFPIGKHAIYHPEILKQVIAAGHTVGSHTWSHVDLLAVMMKSGQDAAIEEIEKGASAVRIMAGAPIAPFFRFPDLRHPLEMLTYLGGRNIATFSTDIDSFDFKVTKPEELTRSLIGKLNKAGRGIIMMHDFQKVTSVALPQILGEFQKNGFKVVHMVPKSVLMTLAQYDDAVAKER